MEIRCLAETESSRVKLSLGLSVLIELSLGTDGGGGPGGWTKRKCTESMYCIIIQAGEDRYFNSGHLLVLCNLNISSMLGEYRKLTVTCNRGYLLFRNRRGVIWNSSLDSGHLPIYSPDYM
jgi:hypothetical protein